jgi:hypothetical protein
MDTGEAENRRKLALKLTWISVISLLIGGPWAWFIVSEGGPEALGAIFPLMVVGGVHLLTGPIAIYQAFRIRESNHCAFVYTYYAIFLFVTASLFPRDIFTYIIFFVLVTMVPILLSLVVTLFKSHER